jgi:hypothetical protein
MKICLSPNFSAFKSLNIQQTNFPMPLIPQADRFERTKIGLAGENSATKILDHFKKIDMEEYDRLSEDEKQILRAEFATWEPKEQKDLCDNLTVAKFLKQRYDKSYGRGNYVYVSIGRSCNTIARALEYLGVETKNIPISGLHDKNGETTNETVARMLENPGFEAYLNYFRQIGIDKKSVATSKKSYIFQDYTSGGRSLLAFSKFIKSEEVGLDLSNVHIESINDATKSMWREDTGAQFNYSDFMKNTIYKSTLKRYSTVCEMPWQKMGEVRNAVYPNFKPSNEAKLFDFITIDKIRHEN